MKRRVSGDSMSYWMSCGSVRLSVKSETRHNTGVNALRSFSKGAILYSHEPGSASMRSPTVWIASSSSNDALRWLGS